VLHFAGAASLPSNQPICPATAAGLRSGFLARVSGRVDVLERDGALFLLEQRATHLPAGFRHFSASSAEWSVMISGVFYGDSAALPWLAPATDTVTSHTFTPASLRDVNGDFSAIAWHSTTRRLVLTSSFMGVFPLYYTEAAGTIVWASSLGMLRGVCDSLEIDRAFVISFLTLERVSGRTPYRAIHTVRPGTTITLEAGRSAVVEEPRAFVDRDIRRHDVREYAEELHSLVDTAVAERAPSRGLLYCELSGGIDSSTVTIMASRAARRTRAFRVGTVHYTSVCSPEWDETRFVRAVARHAEVETETIDLDQVEFLKLADDVSLDVPAMSRQAAARLVHGQGGDVILSGRAGDGVFGNTIDNSLSALDHLRRGEVSTFFTRLIDWSIAANEPAIALGSRLLAAACWPGIYGRLAERSRRRGKSGTTAMDGSADAHQYSVRPAALDEVRPLRANFFAAAARQVRPSKCALLSVLLAYSTYRRLENELDQVLFLYPFTDARLIEFLLAIPTDLHARPGEPRFLMRQAFQHTWPSELRRRFSKGYAAPVTLRLFKPFALSLARQSHFVLADVGVLDTESLRARLDTYIGGAGLRIGNLTRIWYAEEWLRRRHGLPSLMPQ
jgi:asparagine synthase (glutamine-hydrolysing)